jgi:hypothetical protein
LWCFSYIPLPIQQHTMQAWWWSTIGVVTIVTTKIK